MVLFNSSWQYFPEIIRSTGANILFNQGGTIEHVTHVPGPVAQPSAESDYNAACTAGMDLVHFRMLINDFFNKDIDIVPEEDLVIILDRKYDVYMANNGIYQAYNANL